MPEITVEGLHRLNGNLKIQGSKNAALPIIAATVLCNGKSVIENCPEISDVYASVNILKVLGADCEFKNNVLTVDSSNIENYRVPDNLMREMRSSSLFLGAILGRMKKAEICTPGGCELGPRPIDLHIRALKELGTCVFENGGYVCFDATKGLKGEKIHLSFPSVGATENLILASVTAKGITEITGCAKEPEIEDLANFLNSAGAKISGAGTDKVVVDGVDLLSGARHKVMPDRIVAATYISAVAATGGEIELNSVNTRHLTAVITPFTEAGCSFKDNGTSLKITAENRLKGISTVRSLPYPAFPTDAGPMLISALSGSCGTTVFVENIFLNRYSFIEELKRFGANIRLEGKVAVIEGVENLCGAKCECTDLRGGAALIVAALMAKGKSKIFKTEYIKRGYEDIVRDLKILGAHIY